MNYNSSLMTEEEKIAWRHWSSVYKMENCTPKKKASRTKLSLEKGWITEDENILKLLENGIDEFERKVEIRIDNLRTIKYNNCLKYGKLTRTPKAKQWRFCTYDWH